MRYWLAVVMIAIAPLCYAEDFWIYIRTYDKPEIAVGEAGRSKKGDIVEIIPCKRRPELSETEKKEWMIIKVADLTKEQIQDMLKAKVEDVLDKDGKPVLYPDGATKQKTTAYRNKKLDTTAAELSVKMGEVATKVDKAKVVDNLVAKTALDISQYNQQARMYVLERAIKRPFIRFAKWINPLQPAFATTTDTKTIIESGGDYASLNLWEDAEDGDITGTGSDTIEVASIQGSWAYPDSTEVSFSGWTTGLSNYISIYTSGDARHDGIWSTSAYRLELDPASETGVFRSSSGGGANYLRIDGLQIRNSDSTPGGNDSAILVETTEYDMRISNCILRGGRYTVRIGSGNSDVYYLWNNIVYGGSVGGIVYVSGSGTANIYSTTTIGVTYGLYRLSGTVVAKNVYAAATDASTAYNGTITQTTCAADDTTATDAALDNIAYDTNNFTNVTAGSEDLRLPVGSALINVGTDTSGDSAPLNFTTDIQEDTRSGTWDIGADEYSGGAPPAARRRMIMFN